MFILVNSRSNVVPHRILDFETGRSSGPFRNSHHQLRGRCWRYLECGSFEYPAGESGRDILKRIGQAAAPHLTRAVRGVISGDIARTKQDSTLAARCPRPKYRDFLVDVTKSAEEVFRFVGGCARAYPIFAECGGDRFFVDQALFFFYGRVLPCEFFLSGDRLLLQCEPGTVELALRPDGGALFSAEYIEAKKES